MTIWIKNAVLLCISVLYLKILQALSFGNSKVYQHMNTSATKNNRNTLYNIDSPDLIKDKSVLSTSSPYDILTVHSLKSLLKTNPTNRTVHEKIKKRMQYEIWIAVPLGVILLVIFTVVLVFVIKRKLRKRRLQREFLPQYGYDHSEAEVFDGYTTFPEGGGSVERLVYENARTKNASPVTVSTDKSDMTIEVTVISNGNVDDSPAKKAT